MDNLETLAKTFACVAKIVFVFTVITHNIINNIASNIASNIANYIANNGSP
jgi:hypothetical protein